MASDPPSTKRSGPPPRTVHRPPRSAKPKPRAGSGSASETKEVEVAFRRDLGLLEAVMLGIGAMVGGGIFALLGIAIGLAGPIFIVGLALNGLVVGLTAMSYAELGARIHEAGGGYRPVDMSMPPPFGFLAGWMAWFARAVACGLYAVTFGIFAVQIPGLDLKALNFDPQSAVTVWAMVVTFAFFIVNYIGTHLTGRTENFLTGFQIAVFAIFTIVAASAVAIRGPAADAFTPFIPQGLGGLFLAMALIYITFEGSELITTLGEEIKNPRRNIPRAIGLSLAITVIIYVVVATAAIAAVGVAKLADQGQNAMIYAAQQLFAGPAFYIIVVGGLVSALAAMNAALLASSRVAFAMGRRKHLPAFFSHIHVHFRTPSKALIATTVIILVIVQLPLDRLAAGASLLFLLTFILVNAALIVLRLKETAPTPGFRVPLFPLTPILAIIVNAGLAGLIFYDELFPKGVFDPRHPVAASLAMFWIAVGLLIYWSTRGQVEVHERVALSEARKLPEPRYHVLVSVGGPIGARLMGIARAVAKARDGAVTLLNVMQLPRALPVIGVESEDATRKRIQYLRQIDQRYPDIAAKAAVVVSRDVAEGIIGEVERRDANLLLMGWRGTSVGSGRLIGSTLEPVVARGPCDILVLRASGRERYRRIAVAGLSKHAAVDAGYIAGAIALQHDSVVTVLAGTGATQKEISEAITEGAMQAGVSPSHKSRDEGDFYSMMVQEGAESDLLILGTTHHVYRRGFFGDPLEDRIAVGVPCAVAIFIKALSPIGGPMPAASMGPGEGQPPAAPV